MQTTPVTPADVGRSVWAVPPLARSADGALDVDQNRRIIRHVEGGGLTTLLYGGNAILYHIAPSEYASLLEMISTLAARDTLVIPSVGPAYGTMMEQARVLAEFPFPTAMVLPQRDVVRSSGMATAVRRLVERWGKPVVLYLKYEQMEVADVRALADDGLLSAIKYAVVRDVAADDPYLRHMVEAVDPALILSGLGDQPAIVHLREFGLAGFTTGCGCVAPSLSAALLAAIRDGSWDRAEQLRERFVPLERLRNAHGPIEVLHVAVRMAGIAETGPIIPLLCEPEPSVAEAIGPAARSLIALQAERTF